MTRQRELAFQNHIMDSYALRGGCAKKWASEWQAGPPDLVCAFPGFGAHLMEVKHRPTWTVGKSYKNPLTDKQISVCRDLHKGGATVMGGVVIGEKAIVSQLCLFPITLDTISLVETLTTPYINKTKYDVEKLLNFWRTQYGWR